ncbi:DUF4179 domain-containing protein [Viridibacillus sp. FSL R5-0477]|uniref:DUF4179 domain-containing protein n=1 Tax=Viridibacillus arenosi FSL R5-213 TaxID=1227360 RepID=W4F101_9BACL|nr:DUF4179 domain-containing protein [Viridibacillus arenosi]ETT85982.1 hypothetical protein C176_09317 [Viridibacillus arenosi FSL R5-213]OMC86694.1 anti-sigma factor [Viridibacillus arenosi]
MNEKDFIKIDIEKIEPVELSDWEKKNIEKSILCSSKKHSNKKFKWISAIAMTTLIVTSSTIWLPAVADRLPIVQQLIQVKDNPQLQVFSDYATIINQMDESNGSTIELAEAFFDGSIISVSYEMKHDKPINGDPLFWIDHLEVNGNTLSTLSQQINKKDEYTWIGMFTARVSDEVIDETINVQWSPKELKGIEYTTLVEGDWNYQLELTPTQANSKKINIPFGDEQYQLVFNQITSGKFATTLYFEGNLDWNTEFLMIEIKDNLGNVYENVGTSSFKSEPERVNGYIDFFVPDTGIQTLIFTPTIRVVDEKTLAPKELIQLPIIQLPLE